MAQMHSNRWSAKNFGDKSRLMSDLSSGNGGLAVPAIMGL